MSLYWGKMTSIFSECHPVDRKSQHCYKNFLWSSFETFDSKLILSVQYLVMTGLFCSFQRFMGWNIFSKIWMHVLGSNIFRNTWMHVLGSNIFRNVWILVLDEGHTWRDINRSNSISIKIINHRQSALVALVVLKCPSRSISNPHTGY